MTLLPILFFSYCCLLLAASTDSEDRIRELRIEVVKLQIMSRLRLKKLPPPPANVSDDAVSKEAARLLLREEEEEEDHTQAPHHKQMLVVPAVGDGTACPDTNSSGCHTFLFEFGSSLKGSGLDLWVWKSDDAPPDIGLSVSFSLDDEVQFSSQFEVGDNGWNKLRLLEKLVHPDNDTVQAQVQIRGHWAEHQGPHRPYLMATLPWSPVRQRRDVGEGLCDTSKPCCLLPLRLSFKEIVLESIVYPKFLDANMCVGQCHIDNSTQRTHNERALHTTLENNPTLADTLGECWRFCCRPKQRKGVNVIYMDTENMTDVQFIPELSVQSCSCS